MKNLKVNQPDYSKFDLTHVHRTSFDMGNLIPIATMPTLPGDNWRIKMNSFIRAVPTKVPLMDGMDLKINYFYLPYRILWNGFEQFIALSKNGRINTKKLPLVRLSNLDEPTNTKYKNGRLADYLGLSDLTLTNDFEVNALPFMAYHKIYLDHYAPKRWINYANADGTPTGLGLLRDHLENLRQLGGGEVIDDISSTSVLGQIRKVNWNHDYFTNALPTPTLFEDQKLPLFTSNYGELDIDSGKVYHEFETENGKVPFDKDGSTTAQANYAYQATIRDLRASISLQHYLEKLQQADGGYMEKMKVSWNRDLPNDLLQRSHYIGGDVTTIFNNEVESTADTTESGGKGLGDLAGKPVGGGQGDEHSMFSDEFGIFMAIAHVVPKRSYANAISKMWTNVVPTQFPDPDFENIGDEAVYRYQLDGELAHQNIWGFVPRYSDYKTALDRFSGEMRYTLKDWHFGTFKQELEPFETVSPAFMDANVRQDIFQVPGEPDKLLGTFKLSIDANRPLQNTSQPGIGYI